ncbi:MAG: trypsin-like peptidase domain-containing protein [Anaerolineae bacterium]|nr:trypsin-like peptidase domain-containing protein [Anaerolineae bacterium]
MPKGHFALTLTVVVLVASALACNLQAVTAPAPTPTPTAPPTPTAAPSQATPVSAAEPANALEAQVEAVYDQAGPAVVHITSRVITYDFFMQPIPQEGTGSGFVYDTEGHVVTNYHVVADAESVSVALAAGGVYTATIVGTDSSNDLAVLRIEAEDLPNPVPLGDSDQLRVGQFVVAIGNPFGLDRTLTVGVISALSRVIQSPDSRFIGEAIQTDAAINPGNSGGPLLDLEGRVIGVNAQIISPSQASAGIGFAIPVNTVRRVAPQLIAQGYYPHPWLGVSVLPFEAEGAQILREAGMDVPVDEGLLVAEVVAGSPAAKAGIRAGDQVVSIGNTRIPVGGDIITAINGEPIANFEELTVYLESETQVGDTVEVTLIRDGQEMKVSVTLAERPEQA